MPKDTREPQGILAHITAARVGLTSAIYGLSEADLATQAAVGKWTVADVMAHIGRWEAVCFDVLVAHLRGEQTLEDYRKYLPYNDKWEAELHALSLQEVVALFETSHYRLFGLLSALTPEQWNGYVRAWTTNATWHHFEEHAAQIRAWRAARV